MTKLRQVLTTMENVHVFGIWYPLFNTTRGQLGCCPSSQDSIQFFHRIELLFFFHPSNHFCFSPIIRVHILKKTHINLALNIACPKMPRSICLAADCHLYSFIHMYNHMCASHTLVSSLPSMQPQFFLLILQFTLKLHVEVMNKKIGK